MARASYARSYEAMPMSGQSNTQGFNAFPTFISPNVQLSPAVVLREGLPASTVLPDLRPDVANGIFAELMNTSTRMPRYQSVSASHRERYWPILYADHGLLSWRRKELVHRQRSS